jgi:hypothetical protein
MYYRTTQKFTIAPSYHVRSAISNDGIAFTQEGIRIDIQPYDISSDFTLVGHGTYWQYPDSTFGGIFSGNPDTSTVQPSSLIYTSSADGLTWGNFTFLYQGHHDPIVLKKNNQYILYSMNLTEYMATAVSNDGITWPASTDSVSFLDTANAPMLIGGTKRIGDIGGIVMPNNEIFLYTNFGTTTGPSTDIIRFELQNQTTGIAAENVADRAIQIFPNPFSSQTTLHFVNPLKNATLSVNNCFGQKVAQLNNISGLTITINRDNLQSGLYFLRLTQNSKNIASDKLIIIDK